MTTSKLLPGCGVAASVTLSSTPDETTSPIFALLHCEMTPPLQLVGSDPRRGPVGHTVHMGLFDRFRRNSRVSRPTGGARTGSTSVRAANSADEQHLHEWVPHRRGVEGFVQPRDRKSPRLHPSHQCAARIA